MAVSFVLIISLIISFLDTVVSMTPSPTPMPDRVIDNIVQSDKIIRIRPFAQIPDTPNPPDNKPASRIVSMDVFNNSLYVSTSNHMRIWRVDTMGTVFPFLNVDQVVRNHLNRSLSTHQSNGGVRSVVFHPNFQKNRLLYLNVFENRHPSIDPSYYLSTPTSTDRDGNPPDGVLYEFKFNRRTNKVSAKSIREIFRIGLRAVNHNMRQMVFQDNKNLLITQGDGGAKFDPRAGGQSLADALGKILRINPRKTKDGKRYSVSSDNPFVNRKGALPEIYARGFRNPHTICIGKDGTIYAADIGASNIEEINIIEKGENYGWWRREGTYKVLNTTIGGIRDIPRNEKGRFTYPAAFFSHYKLGVKGFGQAIASSCPIENGAELDGIFLFADFAEFGEIFFSDTTELQNSVRRGTRDDLTQATTYQPRLLFDHDNDNATNDKEFRNFRDIIRFDMNDNSVPRADVRFGKGPCGEIYISSKRNGKIYLVTNSLPEKDKHVGYCRPDES